MPAGGRPVRSGSVIMDWVGVLSAVGGTEYDGARLFYAGEPSIEARSPPA